MSLRLGLSSVLKSSLIIGSLAVTNSLAAASPVQYFPSAANTPGLYGAFYKTRMFIRENNGGIILVLTAATPGGLLTTTLTVANDYYSDNVLDDLFHYTGGAAISVSVAPGSSGTFVMRAEVYSTGPFGEMTTPLPILTLDSAVTSPLPATIPTLNVAVGLNSGANSRINIGCSNFSSDSAAVVVAVWGDDGSNDQRTLSLASGEWSQFELDTQPAATHRTAYFYGQGTAPAAPIFCYAVKVSNSSNDGTLIPAVPNTPVINPIPSA